MKGINSISDSLKIKNRLLIIFLSILVFSCENPPIQTSPEIDFGNNQAVGKYTNVKGTKIYYETYGDQTKPALVLIHGNSGSIASMTLQITYFKTDYFVVVADNRTHGKSGDSQNVTYDKMAEDYIAILDDLKISSANVLGQSDGGIIGLLLAIHYPDRISKLVSAVPNLKPGIDAIAEWELELSTNFRDFIDSMIFVNDTTQNWERHKAHMGLMANEPNIPLSDLSKITCPVLVMTSDDDIIKPRHILEIYEHIPQAQLFMMPGATHFMIRDEHELFNMMAERFLSQPFKRPRSKDVLLKIINRES